MARLTLLREDEKLMPSILEAFLFGERTQVLAWEVAVLEEDRQLHSLADL